MKLLHEWEGLPIPAAEAIYKSKNMYFGIKFLKVLLRDDCSSP